MASASPQSSLSTSSLSANLSPPSSPQAATATTQQVILSPCAACKILRRRCVEKCTLAPYFPPTDPLKFTTAHKVFGASNIIKMLQELPEEQRADAVTSMVYEANARIRDPIYGCAGSICQLQNQISQLQAELAKSQAEMLNLKCQNENLVSVICIGMSQDQEMELEHEQYRCDYTNILLNDVNFYDSWGPLWT